MKSGKCDLCGDDCKVEEMQHLREIYKVDGIEDLCPDCGNWVNKVKDAFQLEIPHKVKQAIQEVRSDKPIAYKAPKKRRWFW